MTERATHDPSIARPDPPPAMRVDHGPAPFAALDLGTNNCRLLMAAPTSSGFRVVDSFSRIVRLGEGLATTGRLAEPAMERATAALRACAEKLARRPVRRLEAVATEALPACGQRPGFPRAHHGRDGAAPARDHAARGSRARDGILRAAARAR